jgi:NitT/TauT family transport system permease protein
MTSDATQSPPDAVIGVRWRTTLQRLGLLALALFAWWAASLTAPVYILPTPQRVLQRIVDLTASGDLPYNLMTTLARVLVGFAFAVVIGVPGGIVLGSNRALGSFFEPILPVMNTVSAAIWSIFAIIWFGLSQATPIFVVLMTALPLIITNVWQGTQAVNADYVELAQALRFSRAKTLVKIYLPSIMPYFFSGARLAFGFGWRVSLVAETLGASSGVGYRLRQASDLIQTDQVFAWTIAQIVMMLVIELGMLQPAERHLFRWRRDVRS